MSLAGSNLLLQDSALNSSAILTLPWKHGSRLALLKLALDVLDHAHARIMLAGQVELGGHPGQRSCFVLGPALVSQVSDLDLGLLWVGGLPNLHA